MLIAAALLPAAHAQPVPTPEPLTDLPLEVMPPQEISGSIYADTLQSHASDSLRFRFLHHYSEGFNFTVSADSIVLVAMEGELMPSGGTIYDGDWIVVADIIVDTHSDSVWVEVARDTQTSGWLTERDLLRHAVPANPISSVWHTLWTHRGMLFPLLILSGILAMAVRSLRRWRFSLPLFSEFDSFYYPSFLSAVATTGWIYGWMQVNQSWDLHEYYFHPSLNPFHFPAAVSALLISLWASFILFIALMDDVVHKLPFLRFLCFMVEAIGGGCLMFLLAHRCGHWGVAGGILLTLLCSSLLIFHWHFLMHRYLCGHCGKKLRSKGKCPYCGTENV